MRYLLILFLYVVALCPLLYTGDRASAQQAVDGIVIPKHANVRNMPTLGGSKVIHQLPKDTKVRIVGCYGSWYAVTLPEHGHARAWMHRSVLQVDAELAKTIPVIGPDLHWPTEPTPDPLAALNQATIAELPEGAATNGAPAVVPLQVCYDANATRTCDAGEGIQGALAIVTKQRTASIIGEAETDARGVAALQVPIQAGDVLDVNVPHLGWTQTLPINADRVPPLPPLVVQPAGPLPWPLP